jgi:hypothetical protein
MQRRATNVQRAFIFLLAANRETPDFTVRFGSRMRSAKWEIAKKIFAGPERKNVCGTILRTPLLIASGFRLMLRVNAR